MNDRKRMKCRMCGQEDVAHYRVAGTWVEHVRHRNSAKHIAAEQARLDAIERESLIEEPSLMSRLDRPSPSPAAPAAPADKEPSDEK